MTDTISAAEDHAVRVLVEERLRQACSDAAFYREAAGRTSELSTLEVAVESFEHWIALAREAQAIAAVLQRILDVATGTVPEQDDPVTLAKAAAEQRAAASPWSEGELREAYGR